MIKLTDVHKGIGIAKLKFLYQLLAERKPKESISHKAMPTFDEHMGFVSSQPYYVWKLIEREAILVGSCFITFKNEIGISIAKEHRRNGYAKIALWELMRQYKPLNGRPSLRNPHFIANINPLNEASIKPFTGMGARHIQNTYQFD